MSLGIYLTEDKLQKNEEPGAFSLELDFFLTEEHRSTLLKAFQEANYISPKRLYTKLFGDSVAATLPEVTTFTIDDYEFAQELEETFGFPLNYGLRYAYRSQCFKGRREAVTHFFSLTYELKAVTKLYHEFDSLTILELYTAIFDLYGAPLADYFAQETREPLKYLELARNLKLSPQAVRFDLLSSSQLSALFSVLQDNNYSWNTLGPVVELFQRNNDWVGASAILKAKEDTFWRRVSYLVSSGRNYLYDAERSILAVALQVYGEETFQDGLKFMKDNENFLRNAEEYRFSLFLVSLEYIEATQDRTPPLEWVVATTPHISRNNLTEPLHLPF